MSYNYKKLSIRIIEKYDSQQQFAKALGISERTLSNKLNNHIQWKQEEMVKVLELLNLETKDIPVYFFEPKVQMIEHKGA